MTAAYAIRKARPEDVDLLKDRIRESDRDEIWAAGRCSVEEAMIRGMELSPECFTGYLYGVPVCMFGVSSVSMIEGIGAPWMVGTEEIEHFKGPFLRGSRVALKVMAKRYSHLVNFVDARHSKAVSWLKWLGFTVHEPIPYGPFGLPFHLFEMRCQ